MNCTSLSGTTTLVLWDINTTVNCMLYDTVHTMFADKTRIVTSH